VEEKAEVGQIKVPNKRVKKAFCATLDFHDAKKVLVEATLIRALPAFSIVGMANISIQESKDRIKSSLLSLGYKFPTQKITINLSPSDIKKEGSHFDLVIALLVYFQKTSFTCEDFYIFGELGLDGKVHSSSTIFPILLSLVRKEREINVLIPKELVSKASQIEGLNVYSTDSLKDAIDFFESQRYKKEPPFKDKSYTFYDKKIDINNKEYYYNISYPFDFSDVKGHGFLKRILTVSAAGMHNILLEGSPGCGKSMSIKRLRYILPPCSIEEILEINAFDNSVDLSATRPFRSPHHSSSKPSIFGGGSGKAMAGEIALANLGILFFDEIPYFSKQVLESLREPLENHKVLISRVQNKIEYRAKFLFAAALNPCPCGNLYSKTKECRCSDLEIARYRARLSEPILDRIDLHVKMDETFSKDETKSSEKMFEDVLKAFVAQRRRGQKELNGNLDELDIKRYCILDNEAEETLQKAIQRFSLNQRGVSKILKISRTISDIEGSTDIRKRDILEAIGYRRR